MNDKLVEKIRYDNIGRKLLDNLEKNVPSICDVSTFKPYLQTPFLHLKMQIEKKLVRGMRVLEIGAGSGVATKWLVDSKADVIAIDISPECVKFLNHYFTNETNFIALEGDMENLSFPDKSFDMVVSAGALSYGDNDLVRDEIFRVLKYNGKFICLDSLNHNPIYKINRYIHVIFGRRTKSTLERMPTLQLIDSYKQVFGVSETKFFGSIVWLSPLLEKICRPKNWLFINYWVDEKLKFKKPSFKFTMVVTKIRYR